ncbi:MAG: hypothetical protein AAF349_27375 [Cyanobacteria bacterium P01_A01_bin.68]
MSAIKTRDYGGKNDIFKIVEEYGKLIRVRFPSDIENDRILEIMELAVYDIELDDLINREDIKYAEENDLIESSSLELEKSSYLSVVENKNKDDNLILFPHSAVACSDHREKRKSLSSNIRDAIPCFVTAGILTCVGILQFCDSSNHLKETSYKHASSLQSKLNQDISVKIASNSFLSNVNNAETKMSICNSDGVRENQEMKSYYVTFKQLENQVVEKQLQPLQVKGEVRELQDRAEKQQEKAEKNQRDFEKQKQLAEVQHNYHKAQRLKDQANNAYSESQQWLCLSRQALDLSFR